MKSLENFMQPKHQRIRDPLHDLIEFGDDPFEQILWRVLQTPSFQRLRRVKQLGFSEYVYPGATHTRFSHCIGAYHIAKNLLRVIRERSAAQQFNATLAQHAIAAALVHDVGHGPFSHAFEDIGKKLHLKMAKHEDVSDAIIRSGDVGKIFDEMHTGLSANIADLIRAPGPSKIYGAVVSSQFDADRLDYMQRDRLMTGTRLGKIDLAWLTANLEIADVPWGLAVKNLGRNRLLCWEQSRSMPQRHMFWGSSSFIQQFTFIKQQEGQKNFLQSFCCVFFPWFRTVEKTVQG